MVKIEYWQIVVISKHMILVRVTAKLGIRPFGTSTTSSGRPMRDAPIRG
jgi:hypothetical protein